MQLLEHGRLCVMACWAHITGPFRLRAADCIEAVCHSRQSHGTAAAPADARYQASSSHHLLRQYGTVHAGCTSLLMVLDTRDHASAAWLTLSRPLVWYTTSNLCFHMGTFAVVHVQGYRSDEMSRPVIDRFDDELDQWGRPKKRVVPLPTEVCASLLFSVFFGCVFGCVFSVWQGWCCW